jgi:hypothetical protein
MPMNRDLPEQGFTHHALLGAILLAGWISTRFAMLVGITPGRVEMPVSAWSGAMANLSIRWLLLHGQSHTAEEIEASSQTLGKRGPGSNRVWRPTRQNPLLTTKDELNILIHTPVNVP